MNVRLAILLPALATVALLGCSTGEPGPLDPSRQALTPVSSCDDLRWFVAEVTVDAMLGSGAWRGGPGFDGAAEDASASEGGEPAPTDFTDTNVQEEGVDEADIVETDGEHLYVLHQNELIILDSWPADQTRIVGRIRLAEETDRYYWWSWGQGMFLDGDRVTVLTSSWGSERFRNGATRISVVDVSDRSSPTLAYEAEVEGYYTDARSIDGQLYLVTNSYMWSWYNSDLWEICDEMRCWSWWDSPFPAAARASMRARLLPRVRAHIDAIPLEELLPIVVDAGVERPALACTDVHRPMRTVHSGLVLFTHLDTRAASPTPSSTGVFGGGYNLYASRTSLYLAQTSWYWTWWWDDGDVDVTTTVHKLSLPSDGGRPIYEASGSVPGWTLNQFSMSEHEGLLRVATTDSTWWSEGEGNGVYVLEQRGAGLATVGSLAGLSPDQQIFAVRFMGDMGYLVTFQQIDPLHVIDLTDPRNPVERGELEIPGFSTYLHPFSEGLLLAIGRDGDFALQVSMFDVRDPENPTRLHQEVIDIGGWSGWSEALYDHHAFTYHPARRVLALPINIYVDGAYFTGSIIYRVSEEHGFVELGRVDHSDIARAAGCPEWYTDERGVCYDEYRWWVQMRRNVFIEDNIYSLSSVGVSVNDLYTPTIHHASVVF